MLATRRIGAKSFEIETFGPDDPFTALITDGYGEELYRFCRANLPADAVTMDLGANIGLTACILGQLAGRVIALEPGPAVFRTLERNVLANNMSNVEVRQIAVGANAGHVRFGGQSAFGHVTNDDRAPLVPMNSLDTIVDELGLDRLDLIKIDVEGYEPNVLAGAQRTIERFNPIIYMEFNSWCLMDVGGFNPLQVALGLSQQFSIMAVIEPGTGRFEVCDHRKLVHDNITRRGAIDDLILVARPRGLVQPGIAQVAEPEPPTRPLEPPRRSFLRRLASRLSARAA